MMYFNFMASDNFDLNNFKEVEKFVNSYLDFQTVVLFELFYKKWIDISGRENNMDEFGNLIFLQGMNPKWNKMTHRLIVKEQ